MIKKRNVTSLIFLIFILLLIFILILEQRTEYNKYLILLSGILKFFGAIFFSSLLYIIFKNLKFEKGRLKQNFIVFIVLVPIYYFTTLWISVGIFSILNGFLSESVWKNFPEYGTFLIPTISLSMLFLYRILGLFKQEIVLQSALVDEKNPEIISTVYEALSSKEMRNIVRDFIVGTLVISSVAIFFVGASVYTITKYIPAFHKFALISSLIVATIELLIRYFKNNLHKEFQLLDIAKSHSHSVEVKDRHPKLVYLLLFILIIAYAFVTNYQNPPNFNTTVLEISVKEIGINITKTSINETSAVIPLAIVNGKEKPLTERLDYLIHNDLTSYKFLNKSLEVLTNQETYPLNTTATLTNSLNCYPPDYDAMIIYALYKNGYSNFRLICRDQDDGNTKFADKIFFNLNNKDNMVIHLHVIGGGIAVINYEIKIITLNETIGNNIKNLLEDDRRKADIILINKDPIESPLFN